jgi:hypothetical protein
VKPRTGRAWWPSYGGGRRQAHGPHRGSDAPLARLRGCWDRLQAGSPPVLPNVGRAPRRHARTARWPEQGPGPLSCRLGSVTPHPRVSVSEHLILPAIRAEARRLKTPEDTLIEAVAGTLVFAMSRTRSASIRQRHACSCSLGPPAFRKPLTALACWSGRRVSSGRGAQTRSPAARSSGSNDLAPSWPAGNLGAS